MVLASNDFSEGNEYLLTVTGVKKIKRFLSHEHTPTVDCTLVTAFSKFLKKLAFTCPAGYVYDLFS